MVDVARLAGVSKMTVSRALRDPSLVSAETLRRIEEALRNLDYVPDLVASSFASQQSRFIAVVVPTVASSLFADTVKGVSDVVAARGLQLLLGETGYSPEIEEELVSTFLGYKPHGVILVGADQTERSQRLLRRSGVPVVLTWHLSKQPLFDEIGLSNEDAIRAVTRHLLARGRERLVFIGSQTSDSRAQRRLMGFRSALRARRLRPAEILLLDDITHMQAGRSAIEGLLSRGLQFDGVVGVNDVVAAGALFALMRSGLKVPQDVSVAGFGDFDFASEMLPALTTVRVPRYEIGSQAAEMLFASNLGSLRRVDLGFEVVVRETG
jgi:LacI family gluconate utilization system Gnt-I transcriptional repressor